VIAMAESGHRSAGGGRGVRWLQITAEGIDGEVFGAGRPAAC
jgi:hypothetical protein